MLSLLTYVAVVIFVIGLIYKMLCWFRLSIGETKYSTKERFFSAISGIFSCIFSKKIFILIKSIFLDVLLQIRTLREDILRWVMHIFIYGGFLALFVMHALGKYIFSEYYPYKNPFLFLRDLFGLLVLVGIVIAIIRRFALNIPNLRTDRSDIYGIFIVLLIICSGLFFEGVKISSYSSFKGMVEEYSDLSMDEAKPLLAYWVKEFGTVAPGLKGPFSGDILKAGRELHMENCAECHSKSSGAFLGYGTAKMIRPFALSLDKHSVKSFIFYFHVILFLFFVAYLPFSKMFHIFATPISLILNALMDKEGSNPANVITKQIIELDACTHCGTCSRQCSAAPIIDEISNIRILPSEKIPSIKSLVKKRELRDEELKEIQEGVYLCTNCYRCTVVCPSGINLQDLWFSVREALFQKDVAELSVLSPLSFYRGLRRDEIKDFERPISCAKSLIFDKFGQAVSDKGLTFDVPEDEEFKRRIGASSLATTFSYCFSCQTCTSNCPVVLNYENPEEVLGLLPHQIMRACGLGLKELALGSNMLWQCTTCYKCQEACRQGVKITDILFELKNMAIEYAKGGEK